MSNRVAFPLCLLFVSGPLLIDTEQIRPSLAQTRAAQFEAQRVERRTSPSCRSY
jgi:hypothetical protein